MIADPKLREWIENWNKHYSGEYAFKQTYSPGEKNRSMLFVEGVVEMAKYMVTNSKNVRVTTQVNAQGITQLVIDVTPQDTVEAAKS